MPESTALPEPTTFAYCRPETTTPPRGKTLVPLARSDLVYAAVQVARDGGENNLHSHPRLDGFWFVLAGRARFHISGSGSGSGSTEHEGDEVIAEVGPHEGVLLPRGTKYWFERIGPEELEILQVHARDVPEHELSHFYARVDHDGAPSGDVEVLADAARREPDA